eukprot:SAG22_NODE_9_length_35992_cov_37.278104_6_plen_181_part_00
MEEDELEDLPEEDLLSDDEGGEGGKGGASGVEEGDADPPVVPPAQDPPAQPARQSRSGRTIRTPVSDSVVLFKLLSTLIIIYLSSPWCTCRVRSALHPQLGTTAGTLHPPTTHAVLLKTSKATYRRIPGVANASGDSTVMSYAGPGLVDVVGHVEAAGIPAACFACCAFWNCASCASRSI